jgi:hypothetical protein
MMSSSHFNLANTTDLEWAMIAQNDRYFLVIGMRMIAIAFRQGRYWATPIGVDVRISGFDAIDRGSRSGLFGCTLRE